MRAGAVVLVLVSGCSLYFSGPSSDRGDDLPPDARIPPDAYHVPDAGVPPDAGGSFGFTQARCEDGVLSAVSFDPAAYFLDTPDHGSGRVFGHCATAACRSAAVACANPSCADAAATLCSAPISVGATCPLDGTSCQGTGSLDCPVTAGCTTELPGSTCACVNGRYQCTQLTPAAAVQASLVGKWHGTMTTPGYVPPYPISLWIYPDGTYWPECTLPHCSVLYYGGDGPGPARKITVVSTADGIGASARIGVGFGLDETIDGMLNGLTVDATTLRFTFWDSWLSCTRAFEAILTRD